MTYPENINFSFALGHNLHRASQQADDNFAAAASGIDLTARQLTVLEIISQVDRPSQMDICIHSGIDRSTVADMVLRLLKKGYIERRRSRSDARRYALQLSDAGRLVMEKAQPIAHDVEARMVSGLGPANGDRLIMDLRNIAAAGRL